MDLEGFDDAAIPTNDWSQCSSFFQVIDFIDSAWYVKVSKSARWMDLLGDYAGREPFVIDGEALIQLILDDPLLSIGREDCSFQILHAYYILERTLNEYRKRSANFDVVFWQKKQENRHLSLNAGHSRFTVASRALARAMLFQHLLKLPFKVHVFDDLVDPSWVQYVTANKPMFIMTNDGGVCDERSSNATAAAILCQRFFLLHILSSSGGIGVALLKGTEYRESKLLTFVYEPSQKTLGLLKSLLGISRKADTSLRDTLSQDLQGIQCNLRTSARFVSDVDVYSDLFKNLDILSPIQKGVPPELVFIFIAHTFVIPTLSLSEMAQVYRPLGPELTDIIRQEFLWVVFANAANLLASHDYPFVLDGTIFVTLVGFVLSGNVHLRTAIGSSLFAQAEGIWAAIGGPPVNFPEFAKRYPLSESDPGSSSPSTSVQGDNDLRHAHLLEFSNPLFDEAFSSLQVSSNTPDTGLPESAKHFNPGLVFCDNRHWHSMRTILPSHQGGSKPQPEDQKTKSKRLRSDQRFATILQLQALSLIEASGSTFQPMVIPQVSNRRKKSLTSEKNAAPKSPVQSSKEKTLLKIKQEKEAKEKETSTSKFRQYKSAISDYKLLDKIARIDERLRRPKSDAPALNLNIRLFRIHLEFERWLEEPNRDSDHIQDQYTVSIMKMIKDICQEKTMTPSAKQVLLSVLTALGFEDYASQIFVDVTYLYDQQPGFTFIQLLDSKTRSPRYPFMSIKEHPVVWQLRLFGDYMDRSMDGSPDKRVAFEADAWQRKVLDGIDKNKSLLVVAPTSAGKTFISYYAMEKVLRESDDGVLVYVAPTKALVTQVAAEVYARFRKNVNGKSCWAIQTRDFRIHDPLTCQILVTVPEMLAIMLLSPPFAKLWTPRIKRIILDEIHCFGQQEGGAVWEQIILFSPCPIIGLSATIGSPEAFSDWLGSVQKAHGFEYEFIEHRHRYSHLRKFFYHIDGKGRFSGLDKHKLTDRTSFLHPIALLSFGPRVLPHDLSLEPRDTLTLYNALVAVRSRIARDLDVLDPKKFFSTTSGFLRQKDILEYESKLKEVLLDLLKSFDPCDVSSPLGNVIHSLQDPAIRATASDTTPSPTAFKNDLLVLLGDLSVKGELPAILFNFDRTSCEMLAQHLLENLEVLEADWRSKNPQWCQSVKEWEQTEKARKRASKIEGKNDGDSSDQTPSSSFKPNDPSPQFTFIGRCPSYTLSNLEDDIKKISWTSIPQWALDALRRGIAVHHSGMHKHYRSLAESVFRRGFVKVVIATGTLALGINAPAKTVVFCGDSPYLTALMYRQCAGRAGRRGLDLRGNVVFYGLPADRVRRLVLSRLPTLGGNFPATATMTLRLLNLLHGSDTSDFAVHAIRSLISLPQITLSSDIGRDQVLHHLRFSIEYLRRSGLLDKHGKPIDLFNIAAHLYYTEPSNLALVALLRHGIFHNICDQPHKETAKREIMIVLCNLFGRQYLSKLLSNEANIKESKQKYPSMVVLPPLPESAQQILISHEKELLRTFKSYAAAFATQHRTKIGPDNILPLSGLQYSGSDEEHSPFRLHLSNNAIPVMVRSLFIANSGHDDTFKDVLDLTTTARSGLNLNGHAIPSMSHFTNCGLEHRLNAHIFDFYVHGQGSALVHSNCIRRGDIWFILHDFTFTLLTIRTGLYQLLHTISKNGGVTNIPEEVVDMTDLKVYNLDDNSSNGQSDDGDSSPFEQLENVSPRDWNVYVIISEICLEFEAKFRTTCA